MARIIEFRLRSLQPQVQRFWPHKPGFSLRRNGNSDSHENGKKLISQPSYLNLSLFNKNFPQLVFIYSTRIVADTHTCLLCTGVNCNVTGIERRLNKSGSHREKLDTCWFDPVKISRRVTWLFSNPPIVMNSISQNFPICCKISFAQERVLERQWTSGPIDKARLFGRYHVCPLADRTVQILTAAYASKTFRAIEGLSLQLA